MRGFPELDVARPISEPVDTAPADGLVFPLGDGPDGVDVPAEDVQRPSWSGFGVFSRLDEDRHDGLSVDGRRPTPDLVAGQIGSNFDAHDSSVA